MSGTPDTKREREETMETQKLKFTEKLAFGLGELPGTMNSLLGAFLTMFYTDSVGMAAATVGTMFFISRLFDGITDLIAGNIVDHTHTKWGKARPWLLWMAVPTGLAAALIFLIPVNASNTAKLMYAFVTYNLFTSIMYTLVGVAKNSLMPLMTQNGMERGKLAMFSLIFGLGGTILAMSMTIPFVMKVSGGNPVDVRAWRIVFCIYGAVVTVGMLISFLLSKEHVKSVDAVTEKKETSIPFKEALKNFFHNKYFIFAIFVNVVVNFSIQINSGCQTYFYRYVMEDDMLTTTLNLWSLVPTVLGIVFLAGPSLKFFGKKKSVYVGAGGQILGYAIRGLAAVTMNVPMLIAGTVIGGLSTGPLSVPVNVLASDAVDYGEYLTNKRIEGTGTAVVSFAQKLSTGLASGCVGWILGLTGFIANEAQSAATKNGIVFMFAWLPVILLVLVIIGYTFIYKYDKEEEEVLAELQKRKDAVK